MCRQIFLLGSVVVSQVVVTDLDDDGKDSLTCLTDNVKVRSLAMYAAYQAQVMLEDKVAPNIHTHTCTRKRTHTSTHTHKHTHKHTHRCKHTYTHTHIHTHTHTHTRTHTHTHTHTHQQEFWSGHNFTDYADGWDHLVQILERQLATKFTA